MNFVLYNKSGKTWTERHLPTFTGFKSKNPLIDTEMWPGTIVVKEKVRLFPMQGGVIRISQKVRQGPMPDGIVTVKERVRLGPMPDGIVTVRSKAAE